MVEALYCEDFSLSVSDLCLTGAACSLVGHSSSLAIAKSAAQGQRQLHFERTELSAEDVVLAELLSRRGPAAWLSVSDEEPADRAPLCQLARDCALLGQALTLGGGPVDMVLLPRPCASPEDELCVPFVLFLTKLSGVALLARLLAQRRVAVMLDLDATLLESEHLIDQPMFWSFREWRRIGLTSLPSGMAVAGFVARLPGEPHRAQEVYAATWSRCGFHHSYKVRVRPGWADLRSCLIQESAAGRIDTYVCSSGRPLYIQLVWRGVLDADNGLIPSDQLLARVNSARPEGVAHVPAKSPGVGFGLASPIASEFKLRLGPLFILDDLPEAWAEQHRDSVLHCEAYRPVVHQPNQHDDGRVLRSASAAIKRFHAHCYGNSGVGGGAVDGLRAAARDALTTLQSAPLASVRELNRLIAEAENKGEALWSTISMAGFLAAEAEAAAAAVVTAAELDKENTAANALHVPSSPPKPADSKPSLGGGGVRPSSAARATSSGSAAPLSESPRPASPGRAADPVLRPSSRQGGSPLKGLVEVDPLEVPPAFEACGSGDSGVAEAQLQAAAPAQPPASEHVTLQVLDRQDGAAQVLLLLAAAEAVDGSREVLPVVMACQDGGGGIGGATECEELAANTATTSDGVPESGMGHKRESSEVPLEAAGEAPPQNKRRSSP